MLVNCNLHNLRYLEIMTDDVYKIFSLVDCEEFKKIRHLHIIINDFPNEIHLEMSDVNKDADIKYATDVFNAFPDVSFTVTLSYGKKVSIEEVIKYINKYQNVVFNFRCIQNSSYSAFCEHLK